MSAGTVFAISIIVALVGLMFAAWPRGPLSRWGAPLLAIGGSVAAVISGLASGGENQFMLFIGAPLLLVVLAVSVMNLRGDVLRRDTDEVK